MRPRETFKIQSGSVNFDSEKILLYLLKRKNKKIPQKHFCNNYCLDGHLGIDEWDFTFSSNMGHISN